MLQKNFGKEHYLGEKHKLQWNIGSLYKLDFVGRRSTSAAEPLATNDSFWGLRISSLLPSPTVHCRHAQESAASFTTSPVAATIGSRSSQERCPQLSLIKSGWRFGMGRTLFGLGESKTKTTEASTSFSNFLFVIFEIVKSDMA
jgi:hypothetical protein